LQGQVTEAHDPPLVGEANDRCPRGSESYVKDFKPLLLGTFHLTAVRGTLTLRALEVPGSQVMDVRRVMLTKKEVWNLTFTFQTGSKNQKVLQQGGPV